ncbi:CDP-glycerol glycerophosphotransferase family protein [Swingsia samuiensis]|uniref:Sensor domain-containing protein n=1 Tax=Swingsia samuiensis TaxID=1293412 RepID=A0A4Y6UGK5_9PROT|nr:CDP-glycerol glycerophosphotransferase family protein [Swingsia samuiensis]QDH16683.1 sensor domain-containing protein [Swingsia samuiensis]
MKVLFSYIAQPHQMLHSFPIAMEMAAHYPDVDIHIACMTQKHLEYAQFLGSFYPECPVKYKLFTMPELLRRVIDQKGTGVFEKLTTLLLNRRYFQGFNAIVVPERTTLYLKRMGVKKPKLIWTRHGAGDRAIGFARDTALFDFVLISGEKVEKRLLEQNAIKPGQYYRGVYPKFDIVKKMECQREKFFNNDRPTILYNPHFKSKLSSWPALGEKIIQFFAQQDKYNLIFAPHYRLFDNQRKEGERLISQYTGHPHILIDPGSQKSIDMSYTMNSDLYLGDVSSQIAEFMIKPRPALFLNAHHVKWEEDKNYRFWKLGNVIENINNLSHELDRSFEDHSKYLKDQYEYIADTFDFSSNEGKVAEATAAILAYLRA